MSPTTFLDVSQQINYLTTTKAVVIDDSLIASYYLIDNNYMSVKNCGKILFFKGYDNNQCSCYNSSNFTQWVDYFDKDKRLSAYLNANMINFEIMLNSRVAYYVGHLIEVNTSLDKFSRNALIKLIRDLNIKSLPIYAGVDTVKYIVEMTFGEMKRVLQHLNKRSNNIVLNDCFKEIIKVFNFKGNFHNVINELNSLRNVLAHFTPLNIYLISFDKDGKHKGKFNLNKRKEAVNIIFNINPEPNIRKLKNEAYRKCKAYIDIINAGLIVT